MMMIIARRQQGGGEERAPCQRVLAPIVHVHVEAVQVAGSLMSLFGTRGLRLGGGREEEEEAEEEEGFARPALPLPPPRRPV
jgi:hypothetical protein